jgi:hypothetical protein
MSGVGRTWARSKSPGFRSTSRMRLPSESTMRMERLPRNNANRRPARSQPKRSAKPILVRRLDCTEMTLTSALWLDDRNAIFPPAGDHAGRRPPPASSLRDRPLLLTTKIPKRPFSGSPSNAVQRPSGDQPGFCHAPPLTRTCDPPAIWATAIAYACPYESISDSNTTFVPSGDQRG